jgi:hypothetical protein
VEKREKTEKRRRIVGCDKLAGTSGALLTNVAASAGTPECCLQNDERVQAGSYVPNTTADRNACVV